VVRLHLLQWRRTDLFMTRLALPLTRLLAAAIATSSLAGWSVSSSGGAPGTECSRPTSIDDWGFGKRGLAQVDVSGDSRIDRVAVLVRLSNPANCRYFLLARGPGFRPRAIGLEGPIIGRRLAVAEWPRLLAATPIDSRAGSEVLVVVDQGASVISLGVYGANDRAGFAPYLSGGRRAVFSFGGGNHPAAVDCVAARVVASFAERRRSGWNVTRRFFQVRRSRFVLERSRVVSVPHLRALSEFRGGDERRPFDSCE
jgi:hypothetical protein